MLIEDPTENADANEPRLPMEAAEPTLPIESTDACEAMLSTESVDRQESVDPWSAGMEVMGSVWCTTGALPTVKP
jgi:hypothetical protein